MNKRITTSDGVELTVIEIKRSSTLGDKTYRLFIPDWSQVAHSSALMKNIDIPYKLPQEKKDLIGLMIDYYILNTTAPAGINRTDNKLNKFSRKFEPYYLFPLEEFNPEIHEKGLLTPAEIRQYIKSLSKDRQVSTYKRINDLIQKGFLNVLNEPIKELIKYAFWEDDPVFPFFDEAQFTDYIIGEMLKVEKVRLYFDKKKKQSRDIVSEVDYEVIKKVFSPEPFRTLILEDDVIINIRKAIVQKAMEIKEFMRDPGDNPMSETARVKYLQIQVYEIDQILDRFLNRLNEMMVGRKKDSLKKSLEEMYTYIQNKRKGHEPDKIDIIINLYNYLADENAARTRLLREIEPIFQSCLRISCKELLKKLIVEQNLTREEIRLFIFHNIGVRKYSYITPLFVKPLMSFFSFNTRLSDLFIEVVLEKNGDAVMKDAAWYLETEFRIYLKFYRVFAEIARMTDNEFKKEQRYGMRSVETEDIENAENDYAYEDIKPKPEEMKLEENKDIDPNQEEIEADKDTSPEEKLKYEKVKIKVHQAPDTAKLSTEFPPSLVGYITLDLLSSTCTEKEINIIWKNAIENYTEEEIASEYGVTRGAISNAKLAVIKKLKNSEEFKNLYPHFY